MQIQWPLYFIPLLNTKKRLQCLYIFKCCPRILKLLVRAKCVQSEVQLRQATICSNNFSSSFFATITKIPEGDGKGFNICAWAGTLQGVFTHQKGDINPKQNSGIPLAHWGSFLRFSKKIKSFFMVTKLCMSLRGLERCLTAILQTCAPTNCHYFSLIPNVKVLE